MKHSTKAKVAVITVCLITALIAAFQPMIMMQLVTWVSGCFALIAVISMYIIDRDTHTQTKTPRTVTLSDDELIRNISSARAMGCRDETIATVTGIDIDVIKAIP